jgi:hypothetical protein
LICGDFIFLDTRILVAVCKQNESWFRILHAQPFTGIEKSKKTMSLAGNVAGTDLADDLLSVSQNAKTGGCERGIRAVCPLFNQPL